MHTQPHVPRSPTAHPATPPVRFSGAAWIAADGDCRRSPTTTRLAAHGTTHPPVPPSPFPPPPHLQPGTLVPSSMAPAVTGWICMPAMSREAGKAWAEVDEDTAQHGTDDVTRHNDAVVSRAAQSPRHDPRRHSAAPQPAGEEAKIPAPTGWDSRPTGAVKGQNSPGMSINISMTPFPDISVQRAVWSPHETPGGRTAHCMATACSTDRSCRSLAS